jgi:acylphosphatase
VVRIHSPRPNVFPAMPVRRYLIEGKVQGVGFRHFTRRAARGLGLSGFVRNLPDGSVEAVAEGTGEALDSLEQQLRQGPPASRVATVRVVDEPVAPEDSGFSVR